MARAIQTGKLTPADELRELLDRVERRLGNVNSASAEQILELLEWLDQITSIMAELEEAGVDLRPERTRLESIESMLQSKAGRIVRRAGLALPKRREELQPDESRWWWWLDRVVLQRTQRRVRRLLAGAGVLAVVLAVAYFALNYFFPTDPRVEKAQGFQLTGERLVMEQDWRGAEQQFLEALKYTPDDLMLWIWVGVVREKQGNQTGAEEAFARARELAKSELDYRLARGQVYSQVGDGERALAEAKQAVELDPESARAHFLLAGAYEMLGRQYEAIQEFEKAATLAQDKDPQLVVLARMRMGMLMQVPSGPPFATGTVTATVPAGQASP